MEDLFRINARRQAVAKNIEKAMTVGFTPDEELEKALGAGYDPNGEDGNVEKAHQVGDIHPNGKWVWTQLPSGKYDWRTIKKNTSEKKQEETGGSKEVDDFMDKVKTFNSKYTDTSKVSVIKTPKGNWDVSYDGSRLGIINADQLSEKTAKEKGWLKEDKKVKPIQETDKAVKLKCLFELEYAPRGGFTSSLVKDKSIKIDSWFPKSALEENGSPKDWIIRKKEKELSEKYLPLNSQILSSKLYILIQ